jgi:DMSO/TMAO reductase YedYZ molybdopterin-dependent catalytic subunit
MASQKEQIISGKEVAKRTIRSFLFFFLMIVIAIAGWKWLIHQPEDNGVPKPIRAVLNTNEKIFSNVFYNDENLAKAFPLSEVVAHTRVNGNEGMSDGFDPATWKLQVIRKAGDTLFLTLDDIKKLPKTEVIFDFKCIEGWSQVTHWGGVKFSDFVNAYHLDTLCRMDYVGMHTPDNGYYVGIDTRSILQPQTILCYEMNGQPLPMDQGYPLRLIIPVKYGIKHLKRIGTIFFSNTRPPDFWYERGYDYYAGL